MWMEMVFLTAPFRPHPTKGSYFTRGTSRDEYAVYTEDSDSYKRNMDRLLKNGNRQGMVPEPQLYQKENKKRGHIVFGTSMYAAEEALDILKEHSMPMDAMRIKSFRSSKTVEEFINSHETVYVIEQNRDAQLKNMMLIEMGINPAKLVSVLNYDGTPITAEGILRQISGKFASDSHIPKNVKLA